MMPKVTDIRFVGYGVSDYEAEKEFYKETWGLTEVVEKDGMLYLSAEGADSLYVVRLRKADVDRLDIVSFAADTKDDVDALFSQVSDAGCKIITEPQNLSSFGGGYGFRFFSPDGLVFEVSSDVAKGTARELTRWEAIPKCISHVVMHTPNVQDSVKFFEDVLGFKTSDWLGDFMCFLRCNEWHHRIAFVPGPPCINHVAYDVLSVDDMMAGAGKLKKKGHDVVWGPGRHTAGNNTFSYFVTPAGFAVEYTSDLEKVDDAWESTVHTPSPGIMDQWGVGTGGPQTMPKAVPNSGLFETVEV